MKIKYIIATIILLFIASFIQWQYLLIIPILFGIGKVIKKYDEYMSSL